MRKSKIINWIWFGAFLLLIGAAFFYINNPKSKPVAAGSEADEYFVGRIVNVVNESVEAQGEEQLTQKVDVEIQSGSEKDNIVNIEQGAAMPIRDNQIVKVGDRVVVTKTYGGARDVTYYINEPYRLPGIAIIGLIFFGLAILFAREKGVKSIIGLAFSILILVSFVVPKIIAGGDPFLISMIGALFIAVISLFVAHGFNKRTSIALVSTVITLALAAGLSFVFVYLSKLSGISNEEAGYLQMNLDFINFKGLLLGGIIIGVLGVLDDVTVSQVATVGELHEVNPNLSFKELYKRGLTVGREHIASLINTLALAYAGASFPILFIFSIDKNLPLWLNLNNEFIVEELIRTLVGSTALILAVPISTFLAAYYLRKKHIL